VASMKTVRVRSFRRNSFLFPRNSKNKDLTLGAPLELSVGRLLLHRECVTLLATLQPRQEPDDLDLG